MKVSTDKVTIHLKGKILNNFNFKSDEFLLNKLKYTIVSLSDSYERKKRQIRLVLSLLDYQVLDLQKISFWEKLLENIKVENWKFLDKSKFEDLM